MQAEYNIKFGTLKTLHPYTPPPPPPPQIRNTYSVWYSILFWRTVDSRDATFTFS